MLKLEVFAVGCWRHWQPIHRITNAFCNVIRLLVTFTAVVGFVCLALLQQFSMSQFKFASTIQVKTDKEMVSFGS